MSHLPGSGLAADPESRNRLAGAKMAPDPIGWFQIDALENGQRVRSRQLALLFKLVVALVEAATTCRCSSEVEATWDESARPVVIHSQMCITDPGSNSITGRRRSSGTATANRSASLVQRLQAGRDAVTSHAPARELSRARSHARGAEETRLTSDILDLFE